MNAWKMDMNVTVWSDNCGANNGNSMKLSELYGHIKSQLIEDGFIEANPKRWVRPELVDIMKYFVKDVKQGYCGLKEEVMAKEFFDYWESLDWYAKKTRIKSWKGRANTWIKNNEKYKRSNTGKTRKLSVSEQVAANIASRENENPANTEESGQIVADYG